MKRLTILLILYLLAAGAFLASAQEITTQLSNDLPHVGQPVQLTITIKGARGAEIPQKISVNGLRINFAGQSSHFEIHNMKMSSSVTYTYIVVPQAEGEFTIPALDVKIDGRVFQTQPVKLSVGSWSRSPSTPQVTQDGGEDNAEAGRPYFAELLVSKKKAFVGEVVPAELRFYFNSRYGGQVGERPVFSGEGFTVQKFSNANKRDTVIDGENYVVFSFQTAITPVKVGALEIPPAKLQARLEIPGSPSQNVPDIFRNFGGMFTDTQDVTLETDSVILEVAALPKDGRPENFSGGIGKFTLEASANPKKVAHGEPVTLQAVISGQGNFEAMGSPTLTSDEGWRSYPPSDKFTSSDAINFSGEKIFEFLIIARQDQTKTPGLSFSYFDPTSEKYVTLTQDPFLVEAQASAATSASTPIASPTPQATPSPSPAASDMGMAAGGAASWKPLLFWNEFLIANGALAIIWLVGLIVVGSRRFAGSAAGLKRLQRRKAKDLLTRVRSADDEAFYSLAMAYLCMRLGVDSDVLTAATRIDSSQLPDGLKSTLHHVLDRHDESKYAAGVSTKLNSEERARVIAALQEFDSCYEK